MVVDSQSEANGQHFPANGVVEADLSNAYNVGGALSLARSRPFSRSLVFSGLFHFDGLSLFRRLNELVQKPGRSSPSTVPPTSRLLCGVPGLRAICAGLS